MIDWSSIPYPPWWIERAAERRVQLDAAVELLRSVVVSSSDIVGALVFGSYAREEVGPDSDFDVIIVTTQAANGDPGLRHLRRKQRLALTIPCELLSTKLRNSRDL